MSKKKVLIICYYWPPAGGPGVQRWLKFVKYLPDFNLHPVVYCPENPSYPIQDKSLLNEEPKNCTIIKRSIKEPYRFAKWFSKSSTKNFSSGVFPTSQNQSFVQKLLLYIRGNFFIPDARKNWVKPSVNFLSNYIKENQIETIITTGPPHSMHLIGLHLKNIFDVKWFADFRDPWTTIGYHKALKLSKASKQKHIDLESKIKIENIIEHLWMINSPKLLLSHHLRSFSKNRSSTISARKTRHSTRTSGASQL
jgi:hypothetical protein